MTRRLGGFLFTLLLVASGAWLFFNFQGVIDYAVASQYHPSAALVSLENESQLTDQGKFLLHATQARLDDRQSFNDHCQKKDEQTIVLGCYLAPQRVYIYDVDDPRLGGVRHVTAAHEMLHAAYDRLSFSEREHTNQLLEAVLPSVLQGQNGLAERLKIYEKTEPGERDNELHSILGTEATSLSPELEAHYKKYFKNRQVITNYAASYAKVFESIKTNQDKLVAQLKALSEEIDSLSSQYNAELAELNSDIDSFNTRASTDNGFQSQAQFEAARQALLDRRDQLETQRETINQKVSLYEQKRAELEALNIQVEDLNNKLDSTKLPSLGN